MSFLLHQLRWYMVSCRHDAGGSTLELLAKVPNPMQSTLSETTAILNWELTFPRLFLLYRAQGVIQWHQDIALPELHLLLPITPEQIPDAPPWPSCPAPSGLCLPF